MRDVYDSGIITELTQGAIINNCISEEYGTCEVWGCVITPRCDLANDGKVSTFHYLPVIDFEYWVDKVMRQMLLRDYHSRLKEKVNNLLMSVGAGKNLLSVFDSKEVILKAARAKMKSKQYSEFEKLCGEYFDGDAISEKDYLCKKDNYVNILKDLTSNSIHGCYLIESWDNTNDFKIILLRDVRRMSIHSKEKYENWVDRGFEDEQFYRRNDVSDNEKHKGHYKIVSCIKPPFMENIMQAFSYNFTRVGIPSFEADIADKLSETIKTVLS